MNPLCWFGHKWVEWRYNIPRAIKLVHLHPHAGWWAICFRCGKSWNDYNSGR